MICIYNLLFNKQQFNWYARLKADQFHGFITSMLIEGAVEEVVNSEVYNDEIRDNRTLWFVHDMLNDNFFVDNPAKK